METSIITAFGHRLAVSYIVGDEFRKTFEVVSIKAGGTIEFKHMFNHRQLAKIKQEIRKKL